jgi:NitT/TauT family transport system ATP-binding protein
MSNTRQSVRGAPAPTGSHAVAETQPADAVSFADVGINFTRKHRGEWVLRHFDLTARDGEFLVIVGPSGCGKSTLLRLLAGFTDPSEGAVGSFGEPVTGPSADRAMVFQSVDVPLMDWLTAAQNVAFGLKLQGTPAAARRELTEKYLAKVGLSQAAHKYPRELSGGMKQRVQIARVMAVQPRLVLMDEPFAALAAQSRRLLQQEVSALWREQSPTVVYVTHDIREAVLLGQRVIVLSAPPESHIKSSYDIDLPYPRDEFSPDFVDLARHIERDIEEEVMRVWTAGSTA